MKTALRGGSAVLPEPTFFSVVSVPFAGEGQQEV